MLLLLLLLSPRPQQQQGKVWLFTFIGSGESHLKRFAESRHPSFVREKVDGKGWGEESREVNDPSG